MALSATIVWEVRSAGNANNGGGYKTGSTGTDFSQQNAAQYALTSVTTAGADAVLLHANAADDMVGNVARIVSGTNFTVGYYEIISVVVGVSITLDRTCTTGAGDAGVVNIGGAVPSIGTLGSNTAGLGAVAGNKIWVKADGAYSIGAVDTFSVVATATDPLVIEGYNATRGDGYQGRNTSSDGKLVTTNFPNYQYQATYRLNYNGSFGIIKCINFSVAGAGLTGAVVTVGVDDILTMCVASNPSTNTGAYGASLSTSARATILDCDIFLTGASGGATGAGIFSAGASQRIIANRVQMSQSSSAGPGIIIGSSAVALRNTVVGNGGTIGIYMSSTSGATLIDGNTVVGFVDGIAYVTGATLLNLVTNNCVTDNTTNAINATDAGAPVYNAYNRLRDVTTINGATNYTAASSTGNVTTDGAAYSDYVDGGGGDFRLVSTSPAVSTAIPAKASMGALQRDQTSSQSSTTVVAFRNQRNLPDIKV